MTSFLTLEKEYVNELKLIKTKESEFGSLCKDIENLNKVLATNKENLQKLKRCRCRIGKKSKMQKQVMIM